MASQEHADAQGALALRLADAQLECNAAKDALLEHAPPINTSVENVALAGGGAMDARRIRAQRAYERDFHAGLRRRHAA